MPSRDRVGVIAVTLTFTLTFAIFADALLASASRPPALAPRPPSLPLSPSPSPSPSPPSTNRVLHVRAGELEARRISREAAFRSFRGVVPQLEHCYRTARQARPELEARILVHVAIERTHVDTALMTTTAGDDTPLESCVVQALAYARWPRVRGHAELVLPIILDTSAE